MSRPHENAMLTEADKFAALLDGYLALAGTVANALAVEPEWEGQPLFLGGAARVCSLTRSQGTDVGAARRPSARA
jgi:hypothetical protein